MRRDMNFFNEFTVKKKTIDDGNSILVKTLMAIVAIFIVATLAWNGVTYVILASNIALTESKLNKQDVKDKLSESEEVNAKLDSLDKYDEAISQIVSAVATRDIVKTTLINEVKATIPTGVKIGSINIDHSAITINGTTTNRVLVADMQNKLGGIPEVQSTQVSSIAGETELTFDIKCTLKDVE